MGNVNHPSHYNMGSIEVIDAIEDWKLGFNLGNAVKYIARADHKGKRQEDLQKALWYLQRELDGVSGPPEDNMTDGVVKAKDWPEISGTHPDCCSSICAALEGGYCHAYEKHLQMDTGRGLYLRCDDCNPPRPMSLVPVVFKENELLCSDRCANLDAYKCILFDEALTLDGLTQKFVRCDSCMRVEFIVAEEEADEEG